MRSRTVKVVLPCANEGGWVRTTIDSILEHTPRSSFEIVVSANGDTETDFSFIERRPYRRVVRLLFTKEPLGVGRARNVAVRRGDADFYVFLDAHCLLESDDWLERGIACLEEHPGASMVQPRVEEFTYPEGGGEAELDPSRIERLGTERYSIRWSWPYDDPSVVAEFVTPRVYDRVFEGMAGAGMAIFARAETFHRIGKFDAEVRGWFQETLDYCIRGWLLGHPMLVEPRLAVLHRVKPGGGRYPNRPVHWIHGALRTAYKYLTPRRRDLVSTLFLRHGLREELRLALEWTLRGGWLEERVRCFKARVCDDDWLFSRFEVYEELMDG